MITFLYVPFKFFFVITTVHIYCRKFGNCRKIWRKWKKNNIITLLPSITIALILNRLFMFSLLASISLPISGDIYIPSQDGLLIVMYQQLWQVAKKDAENLVLFNGSNFLNLKMQYINISLKNRYLHKKSSNMLWKI